MRRMAVASRGMKLGTSGSPPLGKSATAVSVNSFEVSQKTFNDQLRQVAEYCNRLALMYRGKVIALGTPRELKQRSGSNARIEVRLAKPPSNGTLKNLESVVDVREVDGTYVLHCQRTAPAIVALVKHLEAENNELVSLEIATPSLEDVFMELTGRRLRD